MKVKKASLYLFILFAFCSTLFGQAPDSLVGQTITLNYQSTSGEAESGTAVFKLFENNKAWEYGSDDGEWESAAYDWTPEVGVGNFIIMWGEGEYVDISLTFTTSESGSFTYTSWEIDDTGISAIENEGIGNFVLSTTSESDEPPFERYFSDDFTNPSLTRENFHLGDGDQSQGITFEHNASGFYTIRGLFTGEEGEDDPHDRWFQVSANSLLPMNKSWVVEADLNLNFSASAPTTMLQYAHAALQLEFDSLDYGHFQIGRDYGSMNSCFANIYYDPINNDDTNGNSAHHSWYPMTATTEGNVTYRIINDADDYTLIFQYQVDQWGSTHSEDAQSPIITTVMELEWNDGSYVTFDPSYSYYGGNWKQIENWESIGDQYVQPSMAFELPHRWDEDYNSGDRNLTLIELQGGEMSFSSFSVKPDRDIIEFDDGGDLPAFYDKLATEVGQGGSSSRYHLLKGLHELAQLFESTETDSLKQFAISFGVEESIIDFSLADSPLAGTYEFELDREFHIGKLNAFAQNSLIPRLESIDNHFAQVTDVVTMETSMTGAEDEVIADATDVKVLRAMVNLLASLASLQSGYDWDLSIGYLQDLDMEVAETNLEEFREKHPGFLGVRSVEQLQKAQTFLQTAISVYKEASSGLRSAGRYPTDVPIPDFPDFLFVLDEYDFAEESEFIADLEELYDALSNDYEITDDEEYSGTIISLNAFFNGGLDIPKLLPKSADDQFVSGDLTDPTLGGILPGMSYDSGLVVQELRRAFYDEELVYGYERHDSREEALEDFDYLAYLALNPDLGEWYQTEVNARNHFYNRGFLDERRYFLYPYEYESGEQPPNHAADSLAGHKAKLTGSFTQISWPSEDLVVEQFSYLYYFFDDSNVIVNDQILGTWEKCKYIYRRTGFYSSELVVSLVGQLEQNQPRIINNISFTSSEGQATDDHKESGDVVVSLAEAAGIEKATSNGSWECWHLEDSVIESEMPWEYRPDQELAEDYAPYAMTGKGYYDPRIELSSSSGGSDGITFYKSSYMATTDEPYYLKDGKNSAKISQTWEMGESDWNSGTYTYRFERGTLYHLSFTGENNGTYVKYEKSASDEQLGVDSGSFTIHDLAETSRFAWEPYDNFENGTLDEGKWETGYFSGGQEPNFISDNYSWPPQSILELTGESYTGSNARKIPAGSFWAEVDAASQSAGDSNTAIFIQDEEIIGVQAKIKLNEYTSSANSHTNFSNQAGVYIAAPPSQLSIELVWREYQDLQSEWGGTTNSDTYFSYYDDANLSDPTNGKREAYRNQWYTVSLVRLDGNISYFIDGSKISEFAAGDDLPLQWIIGAFNDNGQPFSAYVDDVRVLKRSDIGLGEPHLVVDEIEGERDLVYLQTQDGPVLSAGDGEINFQIFLPQQPQFTAAVLEVDGITYDLTQDEAPEGFRTRYGYGRGEINELYDIESSSANDWSAYANDKAFNVKLTHDGVDYNYSHYLPGESALPPAPNISINGDATWTTDPEEGHEYIELIPAENVVVSWDPYQAAGSVSRYEHIYIGLTEWVGEDDENDVLEEVLNADATSFEFSRDLLKAGRQYSLYVEFANITETIDPKGFKRAHQGDDWPILFTFGTSITVLDMEILGEEIVTVVSDPYGKPVVNKVGDEYRWNDSLDGVTLWSVDLNSGGDLQPITMRFENGRNFGNTGFYDQVALPQPYNHEYIINSDGYIQVTEDNGYQYYHVIDVQDGVIATLEGDEQGVIDLGINFADQWFFTTRAAAEEFYNFKSATAPDSISGYEIYWIPELEGEESVWTYHANGTVTINGTEEEPFEYEYEKIFENTARVYYPNGIGSIGNGLPDEDRLIFITLEGGDYNSVRYSDASKTEDLETGKFSIKQTIPPIILETAPSSIAGKSITYTEGSESETATFSNDGKVYGDKEGEWTYYTYEKISGNVGKVIYTFENELNPMPEVEILTFTSIDSGTFEWSEFSDSTMSTKVDSGSGTFSLTTSDNQTGAPIYLLDDNQFMDLTGMLLAETESKAPDALIFDNFVGHFAIVPNPYFEEEPNGDLTVMPLHSHLLLPVVKQADGDWVEELSDFDGFGSLYGPEYVENEFGISPVGYLQDGGSEPEFVEKIFVSGGSFDYPHYSFHDINGTQLDMEKFVFQADKTYRFIADGISPSHPFTLGASIGDSGIIKLWSLWSQSIDTDAIDANMADTIIPEEHEFTGTTEDFSIISANLLMPPYQDDPNLEDFILHSDGDYFDFELSEEEKGIFLDNDIKIYYICDIHDSMNGRLHLSIPEEENEQYPVFWLSQSIFEEITSYTWASTPIYNEEGGYFAIMDVDTPPGFDMVYFSKLILVGELVPEGEAPIWMAMDSKTYETHDLITADSLEFEHNLSIEGYYRPTNPTNEPEGAPIYRLTDSQVSHLSGWLWSKIEEEAPELLLRQELENYYAIVPNPEFVQQPDSENLIVISLHTHSLLPVVQDSIGNWVEEMDDFDGIGSQYGPDYIETEFELSPVGYLKNHIVSGGDEDDDEPEFTSLEEVEGFVNEFKNSIEELSLSNAVWVEKRHDALVDDRFVYEVGLNNMINLYFDQNGSYIHAAEDYKERQFIPKSEISQSIKELILTEVPDSKIIDFEVEFSRISVSENANKVFFAVVEDNQSETFEVAISGDEERVILVMPFDDVIPWRPVEFPELAIQYIEDNFVYDDGYPMNYWEDQRPTPDGQSIELVAFLEDGREVIFNEDGSFNRIFDPWNIEEDAKLSFNARRSAWGDDLSTSNFNETSTGGSNPAYVHIEKLDLSQNYSEEGGDEYAEDGHEDEEFYHFGEQNWDDLVYRISLVNSALGEDANLSMSDLELGSTEIPAGTALKLTFTYEMGEPRYILVSGANIKGFKRTWPEGDRPGTFTILAETVDAVSTTDGDLGSTFGMVVVMGGERFYNGAIFQANVPVLDLMPSEMVSPNDQVAAFSLGSSTTADANISAFLPRDLLEWKFGISEPHRVKAGIMDRNGSLMFINGSGADDEGAEFTGGGFARIMHKGHEPDFEIYRLDGGTVEYKLGDHESDEGFIGEVELIEDDLVKSRFDFNADGFGDSLLEVRFYASAFPGEVGFGDPYEDPYKDLNQDNMGLISGTVLDVEGNVIPDFGLWFFQAPEGIDGPRDPAFYILDINHYDGSYEAHLPAGDYYIEASGFDPETGTPYKTKYSDNSISITDANSVGTYNFNLEAGFVNPPESEYAEISSSIFVSGHNEGDPLDISIELYPVNDSNERQTDYPVSWLWVEPNGQVSGKAPAGRYDVVLFSYDNSVQLDGDIGTWVVVPNQLNSFPQLQASKSQPLSVSGVIYDADTNAGIWADVVFVDINDSEREFWPMWEPVEYTNPESFVEGAYSVKIPAGTYKIKAMRWDGLYQSEYYTEDGEGTTDFEEAKIVYVNSDKTGIDFRLNGAPSAEVELMIVDSNTSLPVEFAWFAFFDADDEYGPVVYPHVQESDGNYTFKLPGGSYKVMVEADSYEPKYLVSDASGDLEWDSGDWASAATLNLTDGDLTVLALAELDAFDQGPWIDEGDNFEGGTISGSVVTNKGNAVPKARIIAHTDDYLYWFNHLETKVDGSFELDNLPAGNWIVFAEPPFESEEYLGYRASIPNWDNPISVSSNSSTTGIKLTLQGSNVSGRIMYPRKDDNGRVKLVGLSDAFLWAFQDENQTGEPNYNYEQGEEFVFNEAYGETNKDGFFSLSLPEAGKYSMRVDVPGMLANLALEPIHFELKNPSKEMRLGNAIRIDWSKSEVRGVSTYKLERKADTASVYSTVDDNISGTLKSFVDHTVSPGIEYEYKLTATTSNGTQALKSDNYKVSKPFIYLAPPSKTISGKIRDDLNASIADAEVVAWRVDSEGWASTITDKSGNYELNVGAGKWEVTVYRPYDKIVNWSYEKAPKTATFANNANKTVKTVNFTVNRMGDGKVVGTISIPEGKSGAVSSIWIDVFSPDGTGNWANPESNGSFSIPLKPGEYELSVWLDPQEFKGFGSPEPQFIRVGKTELNLGTIALTEFNSIISGNIATASGSPLGNAEVWAWSESGGWASDVTDTNGNYELNVAPGRWEIGFNPPVPADGSESPYLMEPPKRVKVGEGSKTLDFTVRKAGAKVEGVVYGPTGAPVADLNAWAYAREASDESNSEEFFDVLAEVPLSARGTFSFPGMPGTYVVGLWLPPGSDYALPSEQTLTLSESGVLTDQNGNSLDKIEFSLSKVDSYVKGSFIDKDSNQSISGLVGEVYAMRLDGDGWQYTTIDANGTYSMLLPPGQWVLEYYMEYDEQDRKYPSQSVEPIEFSVGQGQTAQASFIISASVASISGSVVYDADSSTVSESSLYVWAYRENSKAFPEYWNEVKTDENGNFSIPVLPGGKYEVGAILSYELRESGYLEPPIQKIKMSTSTASGVEFRIAQPVQDNYLAGSVVDENGNLLAGAFVYGWTFDGREISGFADEYGDFNITAPQGALWKLGAEYSEFDNNDNEVLYLSEEETDGDLRTNAFVNSISITLHRPKFEVPDGISITFDPTIDFTTTLPDGTELTIPGGASNVVAGTEQVRIVVTPTAKGLAKNGTEKPANYGYSIDLFDDKGKKVEGNFKKDVILSIPIDLENAKENGLDVDNFEGMYFSTTKNTWEKAKTSSWNPQTGKLVLTTDHFSVYAGIAPPEMSDLAKDINSSSISTVNGDWYDSTWFGPFFDSEDGWIYHPDFEWLYVSSEGNENGSETYWFYSPAHGWLWTSSAYFNVDDSENSFLYSNTYSSWLFYDALNGFYNYNSQSWIE